MHHMKNNHPVPVIRARTSHTANYLPYIKFELRRDMEKKGFVLPWRLFIDGKPYLFEGAAGSWSYTASIVSNDNSVELFCLYGPNNSPKHQHNFSREVPKELIKLT